VRQLVAGQVVFFIDDQASHVPTELSVVWNGAYESSLSGNYTRITEYAEHSIFGGSGVIPPAVKNHLFAVPEAWNSSS
jgi:hypothetical protein